MVSGHISSMGLTKKIRSYKSPIQWKYHPVIPRPTCRKINFILKGWKHLLIGRGHVKLESEQATDNENCDQCRRVNWDRHSLNKEDLTVYPPSALWSIHAAIGICNTCPISTIKWNNHLRSWQVVNFLSAPEGNDMYHRIRNEWISDLVPTHASCLCICTFSTVAQSKLMKSAICMRQEDNEICINVSG